MEKKPYVQNTPQHALLPIIVTNEFLPYRHQSLHDLLLQLRGLLFRLADYALRAGFCVLGYRFAVLSHLVGLGLRFRF